MPTADERYRDGYAKGKSRTLGGAAAEAMFASMLRDDPGGFFKRGYDDAINNRGFNAPSTLTPKRSPTDGLIPKFSENPIGWFLGVAIVVECWVLWQLTKAPFQLVGAIMRSERPSIPVIAKNVIVAGLAIVLIWFTHHDKGMQVTGTVPMAQGSTQQPQALQAGVQSATLPVSEALPVTVRSKVSASLELVSQMAKDIPEVGTCLAKSTNEQILAALEIERLELTSGQETLLVSGTGREQCPLDGARMPMQWVYESTDGGYRQLLDAGPVDSLKVVTQEHSGYKDIELSSAFLAGTMVHVDTYAFDGRQYRRTGNSRESRVVADQPATAQPTTVQTSPVSSSSSAKPSFDCNAAKTPTEKLICRDSDLASMEQSMVTVYARALEALPDDQKVGFRRDHLAWFKSYTRACNSISDDPELKSCIIRYLSAHTQELQARLR